MAALLDLVDRPLGMRGIGHEAAAAPTIHEQVELFQHGLADQDLVADHQASSSVWRPSSSTTRGSVTPTTSLRPSAYSATCSPRTSSPRRAATARGSTVRTAPVFTRASAHTSGRERPRGGP